VYGDRDIYLYLGRIHEKKGCAELCVAWKQLCEENEQFAARSILVFCGWIDGIPEFEQSISLLSDRFGNVVFAGPQYGSAKENSFARASFLVLPSKSEGLPVAVLESWAFAKPVLMTEECNLSIGFEHGAALRIRTEPQSIAEGLAACSLMSTADREAMGLAGQHLVEQYYSKSAVIGAMAALYKDIAVKPM
jgi:glycosyltransferase involved in cell wall biosynthesis